MAYSELIKSFHRIRVYLRSFYVYGFLHRDEYTQKSARSYDNERRRVDSWLGEYMSFGQDEDGRRVFLSVDSRAVPENPLYRAFRTKSFTELDITLHFHILDLLRVSGALSLKELMEALTRRLSEFESDFFPDESTVRKKLKEYVALGLLESKKRGRERVYALSEGHPDLSSWDAAAAFFSEAAPVGVIGAYLQDRLPERFQKLRFKHHYILNALDSEILYELLCAIGEQRLVSLSAHRQQVTALPLRLYIGTQTGRQYLLAWSPTSARFSFYRADFIDKVSIGERHPWPPELRAQLLELNAHTWGVTGSRLSDPEHIEMTVYVGPGEGFIVDRLEREKRCGTVEQLDETHWRFSAQVYDAQELLPWLRTFIGRVTALRCTDSRVTERFWADLKEMAQLYGGENGVVS